MARRKGAWSEKLVDAHGLAEGLHHAGVLRVCAGDPPAEDEGRQVLVVCAEIGGVDAPPGDQTADHHGVASGGPRGLAQAGAVERVHPPLGHDRVALADVEALEEVVPALDVRDAGARALHPDEEYRPAGRPEGGYRAVHGRQDGAGRALEVPRGVLVLDVDDHQGRRRHPGMRRCRHLWGARTRSSVLKPRRASPRTAPRAPRRTSRLASPRPWPGSPTRDRMPSPPAPRPPGSGPCRPPRSWPCG